MKARFILFILLGPMVWFCSCKKNGDPTDQSPVCSIDSSLISRETYTDLSGFIINREYSYDSQHRISQISNYADTNTGYFTYKGFDSVLLINNTTGGGKYLVVRSFNSYGEHTSTSILSLGKQNDTLGWGKFYYSYNSLHQVESSKLLDAQYTNGKQTSLKTDSSIYTWTDGNLVRILRSNGTQNTISYVQNSNGQFEHNTPAENSFLLYNMIHSKPLLSKDLVSKIADNFGQTVSFSYTFEDFGRVKTMLISGDRTFNYAGPFAFTYGSYSYTYKCL